MPHRFTLDRKSFEEFLAAASFLQQVQKQALRDGGGALHGAQPLLVLMETQRAIEMGSLDLDSAMDRIVGLTLRTVGGSGAAVWLFTRDEFVCGACVGISPKDERLRLRVLSKLIREFHVGSLPEVAKLAKVDSGDYPGSVKSMLVTPIYQGPRIAGALAAFSSELETFTDRDAANLRLLAGLLARALSTAAEAGLQRVEALEHTALLQLVEQVAPALRELAERAERKPEIVPDSAPEVFSRPLETPYGDAELVGWEEVASAALGNAGDQDELAHVAAFSGRETHELPEEEDVSVPLVGVGSSLGTDFDAPAEFWSWLQEGWTLGIVLARRQIAAVMQGFERARSRMLGYVQRVGRKTGRAARHRPLVPSLPGAAVHRGMQEVQSSTMRVVPPTTAKLRQAAEQPAVPPALPRRSLHLQWVEAQRWLREAGERAGLKLRRFSERGIQLASFLDLSTAPEPDAKEHLRKVEAALLHVTEWTSAQLQAASQLRLRVRLSLPSIPFGRSVARRSASAWAMLAIMICFLTLELGLLRSWTIAAMTSSSASGRTEPATAASVDQDAHLGPDEVPSPAPPSAKPVDMEGSHRQVTDRATESFVSDMTRFEIAALRRRAEYGDGAAAFQLGMAYEIGHGVPQNCEKAARWVMQAADDGNAAAEYNLGLRYRDGDGVDPDLQEANKWLRRAFAHKYSGAKVALVAMNSH